MTSKGNAYTMPACYPRPTWGDLSTSIRCSVLGVNTSITHQKSLWTGHCGGPPIVPQLDSTWNVASDSKGIKEIWHLRVDQHSKWGRLVGIPKATPTATTEGMWKSFKSLFLWVNRSRADSTITTKLTDPMLWDNSRTIQCSENIELAQKTWRWRIDEVHRRASQNDVPYTTLPMVSKRAPPTGHLLTSILLDLWLM